MKRRDFLSKAGLGVTAGVIGASTLSTPAISGGHKTINVVSGSTKVGLTEATAY